MNGKRAKILHREARARTVGRQERNYTDNRGRLELTEGCTRKVYQRLKRAWKRGNYPVNFMLT